MTTPDAATEALAEAEAAVRKAMKMKRSNRDIKRMARMVLNAREKRRGYGIRKARKSG